MTELKVKFTKKFVKRAAAVAMAVCLGATIVPVDVLGFSTHESDYDKKDYYGSGYYNPETGAGGYYDPENEDGYYNPENEDGFYDPANKDGYYGPTTKDGYYDPNVADGFYAPTGIEIDPIKDKSVLEGDTVQLTAKVIAPKGSKVNVIVDWTSSNKSYATVEKNDEGALVTAKKAGDVTITASAKNFDFEDSIEIKVNKKAEEKPDPKPETVAVSAIKLDKTELVFDKIGATATLTATVEPSNATDKTVTWSTDNDKVATVEAGKVTAVGNGTATITAKAGDKTATAKVTVSQKTESKPETVAVSAVKLDKTELVFDEIGATDTLTATVDPANATDKTVTWSTDNDKVATVEAGKVTAVGNGTATITAKAGDKTATAKVTVSQKSEKVAITLNGQSLKGTLKVKVKKSYSLKAVVTPENTDPKNAKITWKSSNKKVATVSTKGKVSIKKAGKVTITATTADGKKASVKFSASKKAVKVTKVAIKGSKTMKAKKSQTLTAIVTPATADNTKVTWTSSNKKIATVNSKGKVTAKKKGTVKITATAKDGSKKKAVFKIKVK